MRYTDDHKAQTHQRILTEAAARFRRDGIGATGLQPLMKALGLTHGGFYAHFKSKDELIEKALHCAADQSRQRVSDALHTSDSAKDVLGYYLSPTHRDDPAAGCPLPTMSAELGQRGQANETTDQLIIGLQTLFASQLAGQADDGESLAMVAAMVGAVMLARSTKDAALSERILESTRQHLEKRLR